jgi:hypothetical protein
MALMKWQRNEVYRAIEEAGLDPREFEWEQREDPFGFVISDDVTLRHEPTRYWFSFLIQGESHHARYSPGKDLLVEERGTIMWALQIDAVREWLAALRQEVSAPDLWGELALERDLVAELGPVENTPFTAEEQELIARQLTEVKEYVRKTHELSADQFGELEARLDYLVEAAGRLPRLDWRNALLGVFLSTVVQAILPGEVVRDAVGFILRSIGPMFGADPIPELPY